MTALDCTGTSNLMAELYFEQLRGLDLLEGLNRVPFGIQQRRTGFTPAMRCLSLLASQAQRCQRLTDWTPAHRWDSRLQHWLGDRPAPHPSTLSRTLAATDGRTVEALRREVLVPLTDQVLLTTATQGRRVFFDVDNKALPAEGRGYEGTTNGRIADGGYARGYRLHLISLDNHWPLEMEFSGASGHAVPSAMVMGKRLFHRIHGSLRGRMVVRGDSNHGCVQFIHFLSRYHAGYLFKSYNSSTARKLWRDQRDVARRRVARGEKPDLLAIDLGATTIHGMTRKRLPNGTERRRACRVTVPRVVVYQEDPAQLPADKTPECFALLTTLPGCEFDPGALLEEAYLPRGGDIENIFCQLDQAFEITHLRCRSFHGNWTFLMLSLVAATLTQILRHEALDREQPIPPGLQETLTAAAECGLRLEQDPTAGCTLVVGLTGVHTKTFQTALRCSYQHRFKYAA
jgi:Transposase DDE domain group 1